ncbi:hypothetical protein [Butyrivibrio sp. LC3010]|uniref:hypothetical protein n=1 Tax=Butyrivibrio sp. LC3010 TaxID=1280680 RepID=UPI00041A08A4|nr:hypothetical protein [Butyrivibrio sp. LC3010]
MSEEIVTTNNKHKDRLFRKLFGSEENKVYALELYNAVAGTDYTDLDALEFNTMEDTVYMKMKNDVSFLFQAEINLWEHQSTINKNMPLRGFLYLSKLYSSYIELKGLDLYQKDVLKLPTPKYVVFYNGNDAQPDYQQLKLSASFEKPGSCIEMTADVYNVNQGHSKQLLDDCKVLSDYSELIARVRTNAESMDVDKAVDEAIKSCIEDGVLRDFLLKQRSEAYMSILTEYNEELHLRNVRNDGYVEGVDKHLIELICKKLIKGKTVETIADEVEEDITTVQTICDVAKEYAPDYDVDSIYAALKEKA